MSEKSRRGTKVLSNGAVYDLDEGRIIKAPTNPPFSDPEYARDTALARHARNREAFIRGAAEALHVPATDADLIEAIAKRVAENLRDSKNTRGTGELARFLVEYAKLLPKETQENKTTNIAIFTTRERTALLRILRDNPDAIDAEVLDDEG